ncbi:MAG: hypothetical protein QOG62_2772 [Thermoleophilaceae bacterium]|nr:hypothetical protein [Thermoleophilaceae bacterium]
MALPRRLLVLAGAIVFLDTIFFEAITPLLPQYSEELGLSKAGTGVLAGAYPAGTLLTSLPAIWVAGRIGVRRSVVIGLALLGAASVAFGLGETVIALDAARFLQGVSGALCWAGALGWLVGQTPAERRGETIGLALGAALGGALLGPVLGGVASEVGPELVFGAVGLAAAGLTFATLAIPAPSRAGGPRLAQLSPAMSDPQVRFGLWLMLVFGAGFGATETLGPLQLAAAGLGGLAIAATFLGAITVETTLAPLVGRLTDRRGRLAPLRLCLPLAVLVLLAIGWAVSPLPLIVLLVLATVGIGPLWTTGSAICSDGSERAGVNQVVTFALCNVAWSVGGLAGSAGGGVLAELGSDPVPYSLLALLCAGTLWVIRSDRILGVRGEEHERRDHLDDQEEPHQA